MLVCACVQLMVSFGRAHVYVQLWIQFYSVSMGGGLQSSPKPWFWFWVLSDSTHPGWHHSPWLMEGVDFMLHCSPIVIDRLMLKDLTFENPECPCQYGMEKNRISISMVTYVSVLPQDASNSGPHSGEHCSITRCDHWAESGVTFLKQYALT